MELLNFKLGAGEVKQLRRGGSSIEVMDSTYPLVLNFYTENSGQINTINGALTGLFLNADFGAIDISNAGNAAQNVTLLICDKGESGGSRRGGVVQVIDTRSIRTRSGQAFSYRYSTTGAAGQYPTTTLNNPTLSGKRILITALSLGSSIAGGVSYGISASGPVVGGSLINPQSKLSGGAATVAVVNSSSSVVLYGGTNMSDMDSAFLQASATQQIILQEPIVLMPGSTFAIGGESMAQQIAGRIEYYEEPDI